MNWLEVALNIVAVLVTLVLLGYYLFGNWREKLFNPKKKD